MDQRQRIMIFINYMYCKSMQMDPLHTHTHTVLKEKYAFLFSIVSSAYNKILGSKNSHHEVTAGRNLFPKSDLSYLTIHFAL